MNRPNPPAPGAALSASFARAQQDHARSTQLRGGVGVLMSRGAGGTTFRVLQRRPAPGETPMPKMFGYGGIIAQTKVRVLAGIVQLGERSCDVAETDVVVAGGTYSAPTWGVLRYDVNSNTGTILQNTISNRPRNTLGTSPTHERAIFRAYIDKGRAVVLAPWCHEGVVDITGFAP